MTLDDVIRNLFKIIRGTADTKIGKRGGPDSCSKKSRDHSRSKAVLLHLKTCKSL